MRTILLELLRAALWSYLAIAGAIGFVAWRVGIADAGSAVWLGLTWPALLRWLP